LFEHHRCFFAIHIKRHPNTSRRNEEGQQVAPARVLLAPSVGASPR
jgi:hypothetical protein